MRFLSFIFLIVFFGVFASAGVHAFTGGSKPAFWVAQKDGGTVFLLGSMHFGHEDFYPLPQEIENAFRSSSQLVVEIDILDLDQQAQQLIFRYAGLPVGETLSNRISQSTYDLLREHLKRKSLTINSFQRFQPWYVALMLVETEIRKANLQQSLGVDLYFLRKARGLNQSIVELETLESQLALFGNLPMAEQEVFLKQALQDAYKSQDYLMRMTQSWRSGDVVSLEKDLITPFYENEVSKQFFDKIFVVRNQGMVTKISSYFKDGKVSFVVVGVGHMLGSQGVISLLRNEGAKIDRVFFE